VSEFTGERVIPGQVNDDLWAEHEARYAFASRYAPGKRALDVGCGSGYGAAELSYRAAAVTGIDLAADAVTYAKTHYTAANVRFAQASAGCLPFAPRTFDLVTAFEVIEHLQDWRALLAESRRVLRPDGVFLVSTPNKTYYAESRAKEGPNPFHTHEFEFEEFRDALHQFFPNVTILLQNRLEAFAFYPAQPVFVPADARVDGTRGATNDAHFFVAVCAIDAMPELRTFVYVPRASNLLREREQHILKLQAELEQTKEWLETLTSDRQKLIQLYDDQKRELEERNRWALQLDNEWKASLARIVELQEELRAEQTNSAAVAANYARKVGELEQENRLKTEWALDTEQRLSAELTAKCAELAETVRLLDTAEATVTERTLWAQQIQAQLDQLKTQFHMLRESRWLKLGRAVGLGPELRD
jgi:ubiquinone/menaquinone biosynthesis C-methylase UbiE